MFTYSILFYVKYQSRSFTGTLIAGTHCPLLSPSLLAGEHSCLWLVRYSPNGTILVLYCITQSSNYHITLCCSADVTVAPESSSSELLSSGKTLCPLKLILGPHLLSGLHTHSISSNVQRFPSFLPAVFLLDNVDTHIYPSDISLSYSFEFQSC